MKNIKRIFRDDLKSVTHNLFALVIALGVCILPALYAWLNIYSNWDPYNNTGNLNLAAVSLDKGYVDDDGKYTNVGNDIIKELEENDSVKWNFVKSPEEAKAGVESGEYYAAIVINEDFTYDMYNVFTEDVNKPQLVFYENQKKNPVATKISDTVVEKVQSKINSKFVKVMTSEVFKDVNKLSDDIDEEGGIDGLVRDMEKISDDMKSYQNVINSLISGNAVLKAAINTADNDSNKIQKKANQGADSLAASRDSLATSQDTLNDYNNQVNLVVFTVQTTLSNMSNRLNEAVVLSDMKTMNATAKKNEEDITLLRTDLDALKKALQEQAKTTPTADILAAIAIIGNLELSVDKIDSITTAIASTNVGDTVIQHTEKAENETRSKINECQAEIADSQATINNQLIPQLNDSMNNLRIVLDDASTLMRQMSSTISGMGNVFSALQKSVDAGNTSLSKTSEAIGEIDKRLSKIIDKVNKASKNEKVQVLLDTLKGDPDVYGEFFSEPVLIESTSVYPVENYGSAVAPFYTVLALWVGAIILAAVVKIAPSKEKYPDMKDVEIFFGRYAMYFLLGQIQALVITVGDLAIFGVQCLHPFMFWFAAAFTSLTFTLLIYALVVAFSDVGKAIAVVLVVIQIAGSSGTYPIELLPEFFQNVYLFFPFPYAINALRECVAGLYEMDYVIYLLELSIFIILALVIGIWIRKPFENLKSYMKKRMEDTEVL